MIHNVYAPSSKLTCNRYRETTICSVLRKSLNVHIYDGLHYGTNTTSSIGRSSEKDIFHCQVSAHQRVTALHHPHS